MIDRGIASAIDLEKESVNAEVGSEEDGDITGVRRSASRRNALVHIRRK